MIDKDDEKIELIIDFRPKDFWRLNFDYYFSFRTFLIFTIQFAVFGIFLCVFIVGERLFFSQIGAVILGAVVFAAVVGIINVYWSTTNALKQGAKRCEYHFSDVKVEMFADEFQSDVKWDHFYKISESGKYFSLFSRSHDEHLLPIRCFQNDSQIEKFRALVRSKSDLIDVTLSDVKDRL